MTGQADAPKPQNLGEAACVWPLGAALGEGPAWIDGALWFVDIKGASLHRFDPETGEQGSFAFDGAPSFIVPAAAGGFVVGSKDRLFAFSPREGQREIARIPVGPTDRTNDATVDDRGRLWFGTMDDREAEPTGAVHVYDGAVRRVGGECVITNGPSISPCGRFLYHVDTLGRTIWRFDMSSGETLRDGERFVVFDESEGNPDGVSVDSEGCLWVALWGGWSARRYDATGAWVATVALPCAQVTKVAFGGPDLRTAYVTTARIGLSDEDLAGQPLAGGLFAFEAPAPGRPLPAVAGC